MARRAGVSRLSIHPRPKLLAQIEAHRTLAVFLTPPGPASEGPESSIVAALDNRLTAKDTQISELRAELRRSDQVIAVLQGKLDRRLDAGT